MTTETLALETNIQDAIEITEYETSIPLPFTDEEIEFLMRLRVAEGTNRRIAITPLPDSLYELNPGPLVGVVVLPSGRELRLRPKVKVHSLLYMIHIAYRLDRPFHDQSVSSDVLDEILEPICNYLSELVEQRISRGLYRSYVETEENLSFVRGRIDFVQDLKENLIMRQRTYCVYNEYTWDIPENQVILQTIHLLGQMGFSRTLRDRLYSIEKRLPEITLVRHHVSIIDRFSYNRFNDDYFEIHQLCKLLLESSSLTESSGEYKAKAFLLDMNLLFEKFVTEMLITNGARIPALNISPQNKEKLFSRDNIDIVPDIVLKSHGKYQSVIDCKYKKGEEHADFYQIITYCGVLRTQLGALVYPKHEIEPEIKTVNSLGYEITISTIDLALEIPELIKECGRLSDELLSMATLTD